MSAPGKTWTPLRVAAVIVGAFLLLIALGVYWLSSLVADLWRPDSMRSTTVAQAIGAMDDATDVLLVKDGPKGWFLISAPSRVANQSFEIADYGLFGGLGHMSPIACGAGNIRSKAVLLVQPEGAFNRYGARSPAGPSRCAARRMNVSDLASLGEPVLVTDALITLQEQNEIEARLADDTADFWILPPSFKINSPQPMTISHTCRIDGPYIWPPYIDPTDPANRAESRRQRAIEDRLEAQIEQRLGDRPHGSVYVTSSALSAPYFKPVIPNSRGILQIVDAGDGDYRGFTKYIFRKVSAEVSVTDPADCVALADTDLAAPYQADRTPTALAAYLQDALPLEGAPYSSDAPSLPDRTTLLSPGKGVLAPEPIRRRAIWVERPTSP